ncbi:MAG TPA: peptidoglycan-binding protein [Lunatimonas sp.]|nr:peptidoglycan-binding protein [Lunatimonas sp.]
MLFVKLPLAFKAENKSQVNHLHNALNALKMDIAPTALSEKKIEATTKEAIKKIQREFKLPVTGKVTKKTLTAINVQLHDLHVTTNKHRTANLHALFDKLKIEVSKDEKLNRLSGETTRKAIEAFQRKEGLPVDGKLSEGVFLKMQDRVIKDRFYSSAKNQRGILLNKLQKISKISNLNLEIDTEEIQNKTLGASSTNLIKAFQEKYKLTPSGIIDQATLDKMESVATSKGTFVKKLALPPVNQLKAVTKELRLNTVSPKVAELQKNLSFLGFKISEKEFNMQKLGKTTTKALTSFQKSNGLPITGHYDKDTIDAVNKMVIKAYPKAVASHRYRIRGSVRNLLWERTSEMVIKIFELQIDKESSEPIGAKKNFLNGFFDIPYNAPLNPVNGKVQENFHIVVKLYKANDQQNPIAVQKHFNVKKIHWVNFTESIDEDGVSNYNGKYLGASAYEITREVIQKAIGEKQLVDLQETPDNKLISQISLQTGVSTDEVMRHVLSNLVAKSANISNPLTPEVFYAFIVQNLPPDLPGDILRGTSEWETIEQLTELALSGIVFLEDSLQIEAIDNALKQNLVSQKIRSRREAIVQSLKSLRLDFTLTKPILVGNGSLQSLLDNSAIASENYPSIASVFIKSKGINTGFWSEVKTLEEQVGADAISDFATTVEAANISKNHVPTFQFLKDNIGEGKKF